MTVCPSCGKENPNGFAFCGFCTTPLTGQLSGSAREEQKVVTSLLSDLVGFTASSDAADPEDVDRMPACTSESYRQIEGHGGAPLRLRVGINTGEALVRLGVAPTSGEGFLAGGCVPSLAKADA